MTISKKINVDTDNSEQREILVKIIVGFWELPEHYQVMLKVFLEKALDGDREANQLTEDYNVGKLTTVELWETLKQRYRRTEKELLA